IQQGTPAVIAMQAPIVDDHAIRFAQEFYRGLADGYGIEAAVGEGRKRVNEVAASWGIPTLYFQGSEPFAITPLSDAQKAARLWEKMPQVSEPVRRRARLERILALDPTHAGAQAARQQLLNSAEAARLYDAALPLYEQQQWRDAYRTLEEVERLAPNYRDTRSRLAELLGKLGAAPTGGTSAGRDAAQRYQPILNALLEGRLVPFLGWELGHVGRPPQDGWVKGRYLPGADEIANFLTQKLGGAPASGQSLLQISQVTSLTDGPEALYERLHEIYAADYPPTILHRLLAELPRRLAAKGYPHNKPDHRYVYFSTAFDTLLEQAFAQAGQPYHLFAYRHRFADSSGRVQEGRFVHIPPGADPGSEPRELLTPNTYNAHDIGPDGQPDRRPIIVKLCGQRVTADVDSVVVTEDQFLDYLPAQEIGSLLPPTLLQQVRKRSFVFFGFSLYEWHFRLIWQRMKTQKTSLHGKSWAVLANPSAIEQKFWQSLGIEPMTAAPEAVAATLNEWLDTL
ncbi:MAG: SIR2 family protein, partial [Anaerolineae bacterium]